MKPKILVVEDDANLVELIRYNLEQEDFAVVSTEDGEEALVLAQWRLVRLKRDDAGWEEAHAAFHQTLLAGCPSPTLCGMAEALREKAERFRALARRVAYPGRDVAAEHAAIAEAALARDAARAIPLLQCHYRDTAGFVRAALAAG